MKDSPSTSAQPAPIPPDDPERGLTHVRPDEDENLPRMRTSAPWATTQ